jgi:hypothetical protein
MAPAVRSSGYDIGIGRTSEEQTYLPGGDWAILGSKNHLPEICNGFVFLKAQADMSELALGRNETVYIPCYFSRK